MSEILMKIDLQKFLRQGKPIILELGCGQKKTEGAITVDKINLPNVDIVADLEEGLDFLPDTSIDEIHCRSVLEHIDNFEKLIRAIVRVLKADGKASVFVPHFSNPYFYSDYTHKRHFGLYSFYYFVESQKQLKRKVPNFYNDIRIEILKLKLIFRSPFWISRQLKKLFSLIVNSHRCLMEFYELHLCYFCPCYGIELIFRPAVKSEGK